MVRGFTQQCAQSVVSELSKLYRHRGGRDLQKASSSTQAATKQARVKRTVRKRPRQYGNPMFFFAARQKAQGSPLSRQEIQKSWSRLSAANQAMWRDMARNEVRKNRSQASMSANFCEQFADDLASFNFPWGLGDDKFPLREDVLENFLTPFRRKESGLAYLEELKGSLQFEEQEACAEYVKAVKNGTVKYHSMSAAALGAKATMLSCVTSENLKNFPAAEDIMRAAAPHAHCWSRHPGLCKTEHGGKVAAISNFTRMFPKEPCIIRCESQGRNKKVLYVKVTIGQVSVISI